MQKLDLQKNPIKTITDKQIHNSNLYKLICKYHY